MDKERVIITCKFEDGWKAYLEADPKAWEAGKSEAEAVGKLHISFPQLFGEVRQEPVERQ